MTVTNIPYRLDRRCISCGELIVVHDPEELPLIEAEKKCLVCRILYLDLLKRLGRNCLNAEPSEN